jgi:hypothetical protein
LGSLHGLYGAWQHPNLVGCPTQGVAGRSCDILDGTDVADYFGGYALPDPNSAVVGPQNQGGTIHDAWIQAFQSAGFDSEWGYWEDTLAGTDIISGPGNGVIPPTYTPVLSGVKNYYYQSSINGNVLTPMAVKATTFNLNPQDLVNESINHTALVNQYSADLPAPSISDTGKIYMVRQYPVVFKHIYGLSGAVMYAAPSQSNALAFTQTAAQTAATSFIQQSLGMPTDAVLTSVLERWQTTPSTGAAIPIAYEFIWTHANGMGGGDAIKVVVDDWQTSTQTCTQTGIIGNDPNKGPIKGCIAWTTTYTDNPNISYGYRLWRKLGGADSSLQSGTTSIDAATAATALPAGDIVTSYRQALWSPPASVSSSKGAVSAWIFTVNGSQDVAIDASTGKYLGGVAYK